MSISSIISNINRLERDIANLKKQEATESSKELRIAKNIDSLSKQASNTSSTSSLNNKLNQIRSKQSELIRVEKKKADLARKINEKGKQLRNYQADLLKEQDRERKRQESDQLSFQRSITLELERQNQLTQELNQSVDYQEKELAKEYDIFISHSSEDKEDFVRPLALELQRCELKVWYDEFELKVGDSLRRSIDKGLINSKYGIVVLSESFFKRNWTQYELDGFVNREMNGMKVILPIWHKVTKDQVQSFSPSLADKVALNSVMFSVEEIANQIKELFR